MKLVKKLLAVAALACSAAVPVQAAPVYTVGGVTWDAGSVLDFSSFSIAIRQFVDQTTGVLSGFGVITTINGTGQSQFCATCELTFQYGGFTPGVAGSLPTTPGQVIPYSGGFVNVYVGSNTGSGAVPNGGLNPLDLTLANTGDGQLWLGLTGHNFGGSSLTGTVQGTASKITALTGAGQLDATSGLAQAYFDSNLQTDGADWTISTSFTSLLNGAFDAVGTGNFFSKSVIFVPEPASLSLVGLALFAAGLAHRRASKKRGS